VWAKARGGSSPLIRIDRLSRGFHDDGFGSCPRSPNLWEGLVSRTATALVFGEAEGADAVLYFEPIGAADSGFVVLREDAPRPGPDDDTPWQLLCIDCVLDSWPDIAVPFAST
jgi:hypothetical protein